MRAFADLYAQLDATTSSHAKLAALVGYLRAAPDADAAWAVYFLAGGKPRQLVPVRVLATFARTASGLPEWLFDECYQAVGDLAEAIALVLPEGDHADDASLAEWMETRLQPLRGQAPELVLPRLAALCRGLPLHARLVLMKLITGAFRVGVSKLLVTRALAEVGNTDPKRVAQRLMGYTGIDQPPTAERYRALFADASVDGHALDAGHPYPFFLAHPLQAEVEAFNTLLGPPSEWQVEWKWDGIRAQLVRRADSAWVWSRGEELITDRFPELSSMAQILPSGTVLDGEIVVWREGRVQPFAVLQQRIGRKTLNARVLRDAPAVMLAYDLLEWRGQDWRERTQGERRAQLERLIAEFAHPALELSPLLQGDDWLHLARQREASRALGVEGLMLKRRDARYGVGRTKDAGVWWKWKIDPFSIDAVLIYAQRGHGRRASLYTDYTFAVWDAPPDAPERKLVPFAKAYSGLSDAEIRQVDALIRKTTVESFGPVRSVTPTLVFELGFEGIARSARHKSGIAVRFPRMLRWRHDKSVAEADTLQTLESLLPPP
ncbi:ATP-dependent DNA ligase [Ralstonia sp. ASV6]|uniref:ATP-dependent DNA ligase n=1 Tax=Ralstonia sp. ASV6 TaxID=2795124 RepID=UPI0018EB6961|nr:ATP-dependent DNA ligase [Ralstonia sp. ASV6]